MSWELAAVIVLGTVLAFMPFAWAWYLDRRARNQTPAEGGPEPGDLAKAQEAAVLEAMAHLAANARRRIG